MTSTAEVDLSDRRIAALLAKRAAKRIDSPTGAVSGVASIDVASLPLEDRVQVLVADLALDIIESGVLSELVMEGLAQALGDLISALPNASIRHRALELLTDRVTYCANHAALALHEPANTSAV